MYMVLRRKLVNTAKAGGGLIGVKHKDYSSSANNRVSLFP